MKKTLAMVIAVVMALVIFTGCNSKKDNGYEIFGCCKSQLDKGFCSGYVHCTRYGVYGSGAYEYCVQTRDYRKAHGENVSKVNCEFINGELHWYFISIAE